MKRTCNHARIARARTTLVLGEAVVAAVTARRRRLGDRSAASRGGPRVAPWIDMATSTQRHFAAGPAEPHEPAPQRQAHSGWSWRAGSIAGIDLYVHATFVLLLGWVAITRWLRSQDVLDALGGVLLTATVFGIVVFHELGHALVARRFGIRTLDITLLPIGGVARLERMPEDPKQELLVALAGPAVNVVLAALFFAAVAINGDELDARALMASSPLVSLMWINVALATFNMLPAFPMDGGRVLRALLAMRMDHLQATDWAAQIGQILALVLGLVGLFFNPMLVLVALFVWMGAREESAVEHLRYSLQGVTVGHAMMRTFRVLSPDETIADAVEHVLSGFQQDFPVVDAGGVVGVLMREDLLRAVASSAHGARVRDVMRRDFAVARVDEPVMQALQRANARSCRAVPVVVDGSIVGLLTPERVGELLMMRQ
jgi:Zn-dependent protease/predicted transcriptional regulator